VRRASSAIVAMAASTSSGSRRAPVGAGAAPILMSRTPGTPVRVIGTWLSVDWSRPALSWETELAPVPDQDERLRNQQRRRQAHRDEDRSWQSGRFGAGEPEDPLRRLEGVPLRSALYPSALLPASAASGTKLRRRARPGDNARTE
jgi:hypothetical protein